MSDQDNERLLNTNDPRGVPGLIEEGDGMSLSDLLSLIYSGKWTILIFVIVGLSVGWLYGELATPVYQADGTVQVEEAGKGASAIEELNTLLSNGPVQTAAELQILQSRFVLKQVITELHLDIVAVPRYFPVFGAAYARSHAGSVPVRPLFGLERFGWGGEKIDVPQFDVPKKYLGYPFSIEVGEQGAYRVLDKSDVVLFSGHVGEVSGDKEGTIQLMVKDLAARPKTRFILVKMPDQVALADFAFKLKVAEQPASSGMLQISYVGSSSHRVAEVVQEIEEKYYKQNIERRSQDASNSLDFLDKQLPDIKRRLDEAQSRLAGYQRERGSVDIVGETKVLLSQVVTLDSQALVLRQQRELALQRFTPEHPAVKTIDRQLDAVEKQRLALNGQTSALPSTQQQVFSLVRDVGVNGELYKNLFNTQQQLQVAKAGTIGNVRIIDTPLVPLSPLSPQRSLITLVAAFLGMSLGVGVVLLRRALLRGVDDPAVLEAKLGLTTYAMIPFAPEQQKLMSRWRRRTKDGEGSMLLAAVNANNIAIESIRSLRSSLHFAMLDSPNNIVMLTGPAPNVGKSFVTMNLCAVLATSGKRVVVVDSDLRRGYLHDYARRPRSPGLSEYVVSKATESDIVVETDIPGFFFVARGEVPPNPSELLLHERYENLLKSLSKQFDYVLIDTPPVLAVTDPSIVGHSAGCTLLVLKSAQHTLREIQESVKRLSLSRVRVRGVIFNQVGARAGSYGYGGYGYSYYRYDEK